MNIQKDAHAVILSAKIHGVERQSTELRQEKLGEAREIDRMIEVRIANVAQHNAARELVSKVRALLPRYCVLTPLGHLTNSLRLVGFRDELRDLRDLIAQHNAQPDQHHAIDIACPVIPIGVALDAESQAVLCETVRDALAEGMALLEAADFTGMSTWLTRNKNLSALMPALTGNAVAGALDELREQRKLARAAHVAGASHTLVFEATQAAIGWCAGPVDQATPFSDVG